VKSVLYVDIGSWLVALLAIAFACRCYRELWKWARQCQHARIAISFKRKVVLQAPILEWLLWCNQLDQDTDSHGRVVYRGGQVAVAITKAVIPPGKWSPRSLIRAVRLSRKRTSSAPASQPKVREGAWTSTDQTSREPETKSARSGVGSVGK
jgi:hypothetical protein